MRDYIGKTIFIGIDVHKKTYSVTAVCEGEVIKMDTLPASPSVFVKYCKRFNGARIVTAYEAGFCGFYLHRFLIENFIENLVVHPPGIEIASRERAKTDKRDSQKIAIQLSVGRLHGIHIPSEEREQYRSLTGLREKYVKERIRTAAQLKLLLHQYGLIAPENDRKISKQWLNELKELEVSDTLQLIIQNYAQHRLYLATRIRAIDCEIAKQAKTDYILEEIYQSIPGVGNTSARILANELGDMSQFLNEKTLFCYLGLTPREYSSGEHQRLGHITRQGKPILRKTMVQVAWKAIKCDPSLHEIFSRVSARRGRKRAIVAVARRLIGRARACFKKGELYAPLIKKKLMLSHRDLVVASCGLLKYHVTQFRARCVFCRRTL